MPLQHLRVLCAWAIFSEMDATTPAGTASVRVIFGGEGGGSETRATSVDRHAFDVALPCLAGTGVEEIFGEMALVGGATKTDGVTLFERAGLVVGYAREAFEPGGVEVGARRLYARVLTACAGRQLYRIWNYVPAINALTGGMENYRAFCKGRSVAFEEAFGAGFQRQLPAASAVGSDGETLDVIFVAGASAPRHVENPEQVPAYLYPPEHGPRSPSFSRATVVEEGGQRWVFVSGTAAIKGHQTVAPGSLKEQIDCTLDNLRLVSQASGVGENLGAGVVRGTGGGAGDKWARHFKIYLRRAQDLETARAALEGKLVFGGDRVTWLRSDICRAELDIEIEATLVGGRLAGQNPQM